jgi:hypothetical protein
MAELNDAHWSIMLTDFFQVTWEEAGEGRKLLSVLLHRCFPKEGECAEDNCFGILLYGEGYERISSYGGPPTLVVKDRPLVLPEPDGMLYVLGPTLQLHRVEVRASKLKHYFYEGIMDEFYKTEDWTKKLRPILEAHEWRRWPHFSRN